MIALAAFAAWLLTAGDVAPWQQLGTVKGVAIERREIPGSSLQEIRATAKCAVAPAALAATLWNHRAYPDFVPHLKKLEILKEISPDERLIYEQVKLPVVSDRDYVIRVRRLADAQTQVYQIIFTSSAEGPRDTAGHVRVRNISGGWTIEPDGGGSVITYQVRSDPGGALPVWIVNSAQRDATADLVLAMIARAQKAAPK